LGTGGDIQADGGGFQEFGVDAACLDHGLIDSIVSRKEMKAQLISYLDYLTAGKKAAVAAAS